MPVSGRFTCASAVRAVALGTASLIAGLSASRAEAIPTGKVVERVRCRDYPGQTYALYVPSSYHAGRTWPVLYAFDPMARGEVPVRLFSQAAERLGYVVAASNNSRNGPLQPILTAMQAVWTDTHLRLALDPVRVYATGMSGGTLPARLLALDQGVGIIACAGALDPSELPKGGRLLDWLGVAGDADFNFSLTKSVVQTMVGRGAVARFASFEGGHAWPPEPLAARALEWLELGAMRAGHRPRDAALIDALYEQGLARARELLAKGRCDDAAEENAALAREFAGLKPVEALAAEARRLRDTPEARKDRKREARLAERDSSETRQLVTLRTWIERAAGGNPVEDLRAFDPSAQAGAEADDLWSLQRQVDSRVAGFARELESADADKRIVARRILDGFYISTFFAGGERRRDRRFDASVADFEICARMRPKTASPVYEKARTYAARGDRKAALGTLKAAVSLGFGDGTRLAEDPEWSRLRDDPEYQALSRALSSSAALP